MTVLLADKFTHADGSPVNADTGQAWISPAPVWKIATNALTTVAGTGSVALVIDVGVSDGIGVVDLSRGTDSMGLCWPLHVHRWGFPPITHPTFRVTPILQLLSRGE